MTNEDGLAIKQPVHPDIALIDEAEDVKRTRPAILPDTVFRTQFDTLLIQAQCF